MKCHYEVLGINLDADVEVIKKAYRKLALKWHPDKNRHNAEEATEQFRLIQAAYEVLIDPQEKAWYDRHRTEILHKSQFASFKDDTLDLLEFFTPSAYRGFGNDAKGFYAVYRDLFKRIYEDDKQFCDSSSDEELPPLPTFGDGNSDYDECVHPFYAMWQSYCTKLSYVWIIKYDPHEAPDRRIARLIEKENKKERDKEKKKRNEIIRDLVRFVRKRDPRVQAYRENLEVIALKQQEKAEEKRAEILRARVEEAALYEEKNQEASKEHAHRVSELENMLKDEFGFSSEEDREEDASGKEDEEDEEEVEDQLFCVACNKQFKTKMAIRNHQKSKKHRDKMTLLRAEMNEEKSREETRVDLSDDMIDEDATEDFEPVAKTKLSKKQKKQKKLRSKLFDVETSSVEDIGDVTSEVTSEVTKADGLATSSLPDDDDDVVIADNVKIENCETQCDITNDSQRTRRKNTKSKNKITKKNKQPATSQDVSLNYCVTCQTQYPSRNKLFKHLKSTGHSTQLPLDGNRTKKNKKNF